MSGMAYVITASMEWIEGTRTTRRLRYRGRCLHCHRNVVDSFDRTRCRWLIREHVKASHR